MKIKIRKARGKNPVEVDRVFIKEIPGGWYATIDFKEKYWEHVSYGGGTTSASLGFSNETSPGITEVEFIAEDESEEKISEKGVFTSRDKYELNIYFLEYQGFDDAKKWRSCDKGKS